MKKIEKGVGKRKLRRFEAAKNRYKEAIAEINTLRESNQMYDFQTYSLAPYTDVDKDGLSYERISGGYVSYDQDNHVFIINLNIYDAWYDKKTGKMHYDIGTFAHELKHAYQFEKLFKFH